MAVGVVLYVSSEERHRGMIANREKHNGKKADHYLGNLIGLGDSEEPVHPDHSMVGWLLTPPKNRFNRVNSEQLVLRIIFLPTASDLSMNAVTHSYPPYRKGLRTQSAPLRPLGRMATQGTLTLVSYRDMGPLGNLVASFI